MKKFLLIILIACASIANAEQVELLIAQQIANNFINAPSIDANGVRRAPKKLKQMARAPKQIIDNQQFYIFNSEDGEGFVIIAADDRVHPILGYSYTGTFDYNDVPNGLAYWLSEYSRQINYAIENNISPSADIIVKWEQLKTQAFVAATEIVSPLITTQWGQAPYYNNQCPIVSKVVSKTLLQTIYQYEQAVTGCGATALAQVMNYWEWPQRGKGSHQYYSNLAGTLYANFGATEYDWGNMPSKLNDSSSDKQIEAVATLMLHCGIAMDMNYGFVAEGGSGIKSLSQIENAVKSYFRYSDETTTVNKDDFTETKWINILKSQLDANCPMVYVGIDEGGHAFVCDGYDSQNYFHFNWGWSGNSDGYFPINALTPPKPGIGGGKGNYTKEQYALINMLPKEQPLNIANLQLESPITLENPSIAYGGTTAIYTTIKNSGTANFTGDIIALVIDTAGNYITELPIKTNFTLNKNSTLVVAKSIVQNALLVPGQYVIAIVYNSSDTGYQLVGSEYFKNETLLDIKLSATIEKKSDFEIYSDCNNELVTGHQIWFRVSFANISSSTFNGHIALALYNPETLQLSQLVSQIDFGLTGIGANQERTVNFIDTIHVEPKSYLAALVYSNDGQTYNFVGSSYSQNPCMIRVISDPADIQAEEDTASTKVKFPLPGKYVIVANREEDSKNNWYYMTSDLGTASTKRFQAVSASTENIDAIATSNLDAQYIWELEADGSNWKLKNGNQYATWKSGNSANLDATGKSFTFDITDNQVVVHFNDGSAERYLSLHTGNDYFAFYGNTGQIEQLYFLPYEDKTTPSTPERECKSVPYTETFASSQGDFTVYNALLPSGFTSIWNWDSRYGMVAKCIKGSTKYASEAYLISPCIELPENSQCVLTFSHAAKFFQDTKQMSLWISTNYDDTNPESADWDRLVIPTYPTGDNWNWFESGAIDLSTYSGKNVNIAFCYTSTESYAPQWEIKNFAVKQATTTVLENIDIEKSTSTKILHNGQLLIIRDGKTYNIMGQEL